MSTKSVSEPSRYMRLTEVAHHLGVVRTAVYPLLSSHGGPITAVAVGKGGSLRVSRSSFEDYCAQLEAASAKRFSAAS